MGCIVAERVALMLHSPGFPVQSWTQVMSVLCFSISHSIYVEFLWVFPLFLSTFLSPPKSIQMCVHVALTWTDVPSTMSRMQNVLTRTRKLWPFQTILSTLQWLPVKIYIDWLHWLILLLSYKALNRLVLQTNSCALCQTLVFCYPPWLLQSKGVSPPPKKKHT